MSFYCVELAYVRDASQYYVALADLPWAVWLDSGGLSRYDIISGAPQQTWELCREDASSDPFGMLQGALGEKLPSVEGIPFAGGILGYWGYDLARRMMNIPVIAQDAEHLPEMAVGLYDWAVVVDHQQQCAKLVSHLRFAETAELLPQLLQRLQAGTAHPVEDFRVQGEISSNFTATSYASAFAVVQRYLQAGDCYQVNLAQRFSAKASGDALSAYLGLRQLSPAPYAALLTFPKSQVLCVSPERFVSVSDGVVETRPIKGTRPRSHNAEQDRQLAEQLRNHPKDRAENLMIVDLLRNDLGKSCIPGSVCVPKLFDVESYANVHHLVSTVRGRLVPGYKALNVLRDCFPGGSVSGAPKLRAMQIIEQLEPNRRGVYCGAIGYVGFDGNMDTNIAIRTMVYSGGEIRCWAGGGIVADSDMAAEYQETLDKASAMLELLRRCGGSAAVMSL
ncbi:MAG: aminodeoxychorismate synthase component I [Nitrosomonadales bacterium]|nr:aminodeoxychorismate synthase component I [Nitrosomonadales bacterium]